MPRIPPFMQRVHQVPGPSLNRIDVDFPDIEGAVPNKRVVNLNITHLDELHIVIRMESGKEGEITIRAATIAQVILDRAQVKEEELARGASDGIQVGDGLGGEPAEVREIPVTADELLRRKSNIIAEDYKKALDRATNACAIHQRLGRGGR